MNRLQETRQELHALAVELKAQGMRSYWMEEIRSRTWILVGHDTGCANIEFDYFRGFNLSTSHKPNRQCGTGFSYLREVGSISASDVQNAISCIAPSWASRADYEAVSKYQSVDDYIERQTILDYVEVNYLADSEA